jgi:hypothetical protein
VHPNFAALIPNPSFQNPRETVNQVPLLPKREKGLGDEGKRAKLGYSPLDSPIPSWENRLGQFFKNGMLS